MNHLSAPSQGARLGQHEGSFGPFTAVPVQPSRNVQNRAGTSGSADAWWTTTAKVVALQHAFANVTQGTPGRVLDAGCGHGRFVGITGRRVIGVDPDPAAGHSGIHEFVCSDLESWQPSSRFDVVVCWNVLEHLRDPLAVLDKLAATLVDGGSLVIAYSNPISAKGLVTKMTPVAFHRAVFRRLFRSRNADPYKTYLRLDLRPTAVKKHLLALGLKLEFFLAYEGPTSLRLAELHPLLGGAWRLLAYPLRKSDVLVLAVRNRDCERWIRGGR
jgi:SAM-dependent methyltransferase